MMQADEDRPVPSMGDRADSDPPAAAPLEKGEGAATTPPSADIQSYIGSHLRAIFADVANQPVPDRFLDLMKRLG